MTMPCREPGCDRPINARDMCAMHYRRWYRSVGRATGVTRALPPMERVMRMVTKTDQCWLWTGPQNLAGYGSFGVGRSSKRNAHRWLWEQIHGPASPKLHLDHLCRNRLCVNPAHMELVTHSENIRRGARSTYQASKTHCVHGHEYTEANTGRYRGTRYCRTCSRESVRKRRLRQAGTLSSL